MTIWSEKQCMSSVKCNRDRCKKFALKNNDFCQLHNASHVYNEELLSKKSAEYIETKAVDKYLNLIVNKFKTELIAKEKCMDENYSHGLLGLNDSWKEIPLIYWYKHGDVWWDIRTLTKTIAMQLNQSELEKPYPIFPENPFTRKKFTVNELFSLRSRINILQNINKNSMVSPAEQSGDVKININIALAKFLTFPEKLLDTIRNECSQYSASEKIIRKFSTCLRYKMINYKDSQGRYCGYWVAKRTPKSDFEKCYDEIVTATVMFNNVYVLFDTPAYRKMINKMVKLEQEEYEI